MSDSTNSEQDEALKEINEQHQLACRMQESAIKVNQAVALYNQSKANYWKRLGFAAGGFLALSWAWSLWFWIAH